RHDLRPVRGDLLLVAQDVGPAARRAARQDPLLAAIHRDESRVLPDASDRPARHAAPRLHVRAGARRGRAQSGVDHRRVPDGAGAAHADAVDRVRRRGAPDYRCVRLGVRALRGVMSAHTSMGLDNRKMAFWAFIGSECLLFGSLISTYLVYKGKSVVGPYPPEILNIPFTSVSTFDLLMSSLMMVLAL